MEAIERARGLAAGMAGVRLVRGEKVWRLGGGRMGGL
jgi:hypothetical protein